MLGLILISHGSLAAGMREAAEMILGDQEDLIVLGLYPGDTVEDFSEKLERAIRCFEDPGRVLILSDLPSGTPSNTANRMVLQHHVRCLSGCNLPMLLEVLSCRTDETVDEMAKLAIAAAKDGLIDSKELMERLKT